MDKDAGANSENGGMLKTSATNVVGSNVGLGVGSGSGSGSGVMNNADTVSANGGASVGSGAGISASVGPGANSSTSAGAPAGIFSSAELTVDTENLPPELGGPVDAQRAADNAVHAQGNNGKIASALGKRAVHANARAMQVADERTENGRIEAAVNQDVKLVPSAKPKKGKGAIVAVIVLLLLVVGGGVVFMFTDIPAKLGLFGWSKQDDTMTLGEAYDDFVNYLNNGPEDAGYVYVPNGDDANERFYLVAARQFTYSEEVSEYYNNLEYKASRLEDLTSGQSDQRIALMVQFLKRVLPIIELFICRSDYLQEMQVMVSNNDLLAAQAYAEQLNISESSDLLFEALRSNTLEYINNSLKIYEIYAIHDCYMENLLDEECAAEIPDEQLRTLQELNESLVETMHRNLSICESRIDNAVSGIGNLIQEKQSDD